MAHGQRESFFIRQDLRTANQELVSGFKSIVRNLEFTPSKPGFCVSPIRASEFKIRVVHDGHILGSQIKGVVNPNSVLLIANTANSSCVSSELHKNFKLEGELYRLCKDAP